MRNNSLENQKSLLNKNKKFRRVMKYTLCTSASSAFLQI